MDQIQLSCDRQHKHGGVWLDLALQQPAASLDCADIWKIYQCGFNLIFEFALLVRFAWIQWCAMWRINQEIVDRQFWGLEELQVRHVANYKNIMNNIMNSAIEWNTAAK